ncbi:helix-turn-helix transcriptional regulator [Myceligenerans crystallogenes]|uniref:HTH cro/C1-type domain-containing protein n=1 Tax=Myceligenerans crystallogenes TaxID=316335 RepID=A0ABP4ZVN8_9MICO
MIGSDETIGDRIAHHRKVRRLTQTALAERASVSVSILRKIEQGSRDATPVLVAALAKALSVDVSTLNGQPYDRNGRRPDQIHALMPPLRRALAYWDVAPAPETSPRGWGLLEADAREVSRLRQAGQHMQVAARLPALLLETTARAEDTIGGERERYFEILTVLLFAAHSVTYKTGYEDLSTVVEDRLVWASAQSSDPLMQALAAWARTTSLLRAGAYDVGQTLLERAQADVDVRVDGSAGQYMAGSLHLRGAILAARAGDAQSAETHLVEARNLADRAGADSNGGWYQLTFGPSNVGVHDVATAIELGDGPTALNRAEPLRLASGFPAIRAGHHYMDLARAYLWQGRNDRALACLYRARELAPQQTRHHPTTREVLRMLVRAHRQANEPLARFSAWVGMVKAPE